MKLSRSVVFVLSVVQVYTYHDPDLNYHINQLQNLNIQKNGYDYPVPAVQLTTSGIKLPSSTAYTGPNTFYSDPTVYSAPAYVPPSPQVAYGVPAINYASSSNAPQREVHGYQTSAGLSSYTGAPRTVIPQATYARAPIIAKITAAPLIAKYATAPAKAPFFNQNYISSNIDNPASPVVSQVIASNSVRYAASPTLRAQPQYVTSQANVGFVPNAAAVSQYAAPIISQYVQPQFSQFVPPPPPPQFQVPKTTVPQIFAAAPVAQYSAPVINHYATPAVQQAVPGHVSHLASPITKNVHTDFLENYDPHPRYSYSYSVNDPHTGDIKQQSEQRDGEVVKGQYSLVEPDGSVRTVDYVADWETGFHANVRNSKHHSH